MITLASDFGVPYPAAMRGVIASDCDARMIDITHQFPRQDVRTAAFWLREVLPYYPPAVHCAVVDPGVGTDRSALVVRAGEHALVGPDNGLLLPAARQLADTVEVFEWAYDDPGSATFHGRDVFAPAAATVHDSGVAAIDALDRATRAEEHVDRSFPEPTIEESNARAVGEVLVVDGFGNAITNVPGTVCESAMGGVIRVNDERVPVERSYATRDPGDRLVTVGSHGNLELAVNQGRGENAFGVTTGTTIKFEWEIDEKA
ncbi:SAM hydrolase/SAM-dependent halogenase family protein [Halocatena pleomorpha]|uniref:S-adenosyl-l-methionine hydroxide adenosyltransferase n=1 Tax=Halocatena pleomorpha TaxID=1785090 RepID=A0A3P3R8C0_9EURY|nr:SAM-dependent chlorinase/fluorinase [Halocatena pleomorpha]RRJ28880.1 S-adenosyl-l-methionine hydroxide adenosyltransferase [Halocatena pleomorpha]